MRRMAPKVEAIRAPGAFLAVDSDVPADMTLSQWRRAQDGPRRPPRTLRDAVRGRR